LVAARFLRCTHYTFLYHASYPLWYGCLVALPLHCGGCMLREPTCRTTGRRDIVRRCGGCMVAGDGNPSYGCGDAGVARPCKHQTCSSGCNVSNAPCTAVGGGRPNGVWAMAFAWAVWFFFGQATGPHARRTRTRAHAHLLTLLAVEWTVPGLASAVQRKICTHALCFGVAACLSLWLCAIGAGDCTARRPSPLGGGGNGVADLRQTYRKRLSQRRHRLSLLWPTPQAAPGNLPGGGRCGWYLT